MDKASDCDSLNSAPTTPLTPPVCSSCKLEKRQCKFAELYDEALCQVESLNRQVRHLRSGTRHLEEENAGLRDQIQQQQSIQEAKTEGKLSELREKSLKDQEQKNQEFDKERQWWQTEVQTRDTEIKWLKARMAELENRARVHMADPRLNRPPPSVTPEDLKWPKPPQQAPVVGNNKTLHGDNLPTESHLSSHSSTRQQRLPTAQIQTGVIEPCCVICEGLARGPHYRKRGPVHVWRGSELSRTPTQVSAPSTNKNQISVPPVTESKSVDKSANSISLFPPDVDTVQDRDAEKELSKLPVQDDNAVEISCETQADSTLVTKKLPSETAAMDDSGKTNGDAGESKNQEKTIQEIPHTESRTKKSKKHSKNRSETKKSSKKNNSRDVETKSQKTKPDKLPPTYIQSCSDEGKAPAQPKALARSFKIPKKSSKSKSDDKIEQTDNISVLDKANSGDDSYLSNKSYDTPGKNNAEPHSGPRSEKEDLSNHRKSQSDSLQTADSEDGNKRSGKRSREASGEVDKVLKSPPSDKESSKRPAKRNRVSSDGSDKTQTDSHGPTDIGYEGQITASSTSVESQAARPVELPKVLMEALKMAAIPVNRYPTSIPETCNIGPQDKTQRQEPFGSIKPSNYLAENTTNIVLTSENLKEASSIQNDNDKPSMGSGMITDSDIQVEAGSSGKIPNGSSAGHGKVASKNQEEAPPVSTNDIKHTQPKDHIADVPEQEKSIVLDSTAKTCNSASQKDNSSTTVTESTQNKKNGVAITDSKREKSQKDLSDEKYSGNGARSKSDIKETKDKSKSRGSARIESSQKDKKSSKDHHKHERGKKENAIEDDKDDKKSRASSHSRSKSRSSSSKSSHSSDKSSKSHHSKEKEAKVKSKHDMEGTSKKDDKEKQPMTDDERMQAYLKIAHNRKIERLKDFKEDYKLKNGLKSRNTSKETIGSSILDTAEPLKNEQRLVSGTSLGFGEENKQPELLGMETEQIQTEEDIEAECSNAEKSSHVDTLSILKRSRTRSLTITPGMDEEYDPMNPGMGENPLGSTPVTLESYTTKATRVLNSYTTSSSQHPMRRLERSNSQPIPDKQAMDVATPGLLANLIPPYLQGRSLTKPNIDMSDGSALRSKPMAEGSYSTSVQPSYPQPQGFYCERDGKVTDSEQSVGGQASICTPQDLNQPSNVLANLTGSSLSNVQTALAGIDTEMLFSNVKKALDTVQATTKFGPAANIALTSTPKVDKFTGENSSLAESNSATSMHPGLMAMPSPLKKPPELLMMSAISPLRPKEGISSCDEESTKPRYADLAVKSGRVKRKRKGEIPAVKSILKKSKTETKSEDSILNEKPSTSVSLTVSEMTNRKSQDSLACNLDGKRKSMDNHIESMEKSDDRNIKSTNELDNTDVNLKKTPVVTSAEVVSDEVSIGVEKHKDDPNGESTTKLPSGPIDAHSKPDDVRTSKLVGEILVEQNSVVPVHSTASPQEVNMVSETTDQPATDNTYLDSSTLESSSGFVIDMDNSDKSSQNSNHDTTEIEPANDICAEINDGKPVCDEVNDDGPICAEVKDDKPICTEVVDMPVCAEVDDDMPVCVEVENKPVCVDKPVSAEICDNKPICTKVSDDTKPVCAEVDAAMPVCAEVDAANPGNVKPKYNREIASTSDSSCQGKTGKSGKTKSTKSHKEKSKKDGKRSRKHKKSDDKESTNGVSSDISITRARAAVSLEDESVMFPPENFAKNPRAELDLLDEALVSNKTTEFDLSVKASGNSFSKASDQLAEIAPTSDSTSQAKTCKSVQTQSTKSSNEQSNEEGKSSTEYNKSDDKESTNPGDSAENPSAELDLLDEALVSHKTTEFDLSVKASVSNEKEEFGLLDEALVSHKAVEFDFPVKASVSNEKAEFGLSDEALVSHKKSNRKTQLYILFGSDSETMSPKPMKSVDDEKNKEMESKEDDDLFDAALVLPPADEDPKDTGDPFYGMDISDDSMVDTSTNTISQVDIQKEAKSPVISAPEEPSTSVSSVCGQPARINEQMCTENDGDSHEDTSNKNYEYEVVDEQTSSADSKMESENREPMDKTMQEEDKTDVGAATPDKNPSDEEFETNEIDAKEPVIDGAAITNDNGDIEEDMDHSEDTGAMSQVNTAKDETSTDKMCPADKSNMKDHETTDSHEDNSSEHQITAIENMDSQESHEGMSGQVMSEIPTEHSVDHNEKCTSQKDVINNEHEIGSSNIEKSIPEASANECPRDGNEVKAMDNNQDLDDNKSNGRNVPPKKSFDPKDSEEMAVTIKTEPDSDTEQNMDTYPTKDKVGNLLSSEQPKSNANPVSQADVIVLSDDSDESESESESGSSDGSSSSCTLNSSDNSSSDSGSDSESDGESKDKRSSGSRSATASGSDSGSDSSSGSRSSSGTESDGDTNNKSGSDSESESEISPTSQDSETKTLEGKTETENTGNSEDSSKSEDSDDSSDSGGEADNEENANAESTSKGIEDNTDHNKDHGSPHKEKTVDEAENPANMSSVQKKQDQETSGSDHRSVNEEQDMEINEAVNNDTGTIDKESNLDVNLCETTRNAGTAVECEMDIPGIINVMDAKKITKGTLPGKDICSNSEALTASESHMSDTSQSESEQDVRGDKLTINPPDVKADNAGDGSDFMDDMIDLHPPNLECDLEMSNQSDSFMATISKTPTQSLLPQAVDGNLSCEDGQILSDPDSSPKKLSLRRSPRKKYPRISDSSDLSKRRVSSFKENLQSASASKISRSRRRSPEERHRRSTSVGSAARFRSRSSDRPRSRDESRSKGPNETESNRDSSGVRRSRKTQLSPREIKRKRDSSIKRSALRERKTTNYSDRTKTRSNRR